MNITLNINDIMHIFPQAAPKCSHNTSACHKQKLFTEYLIYFKKMSRFGTSEASVFVTSSGCADEVIIYIHTKTWSSCQEGLCYCMCGHIQMTGL